MKKKLKIRDYSGAIVAIITTASFFLVIFSLPLLSVPARALADYNFDGQTVNKGESINAQNRNSEDGAYQQLKEADQYPNTNFSASSESVTIGTAGGGAFPSSLYADDSTRRSYAEANAVSNYSICLYPNGDNSVAWPTIYPPSPTPHFHKVNERGMHDGDSTYVETNLASVEDRFEVEDLPTPPGSPSYDVRVWAWAKDVISGSNRFQVGIRIGSMNYLLPFVNPGTSYANYSIGWTINPSTLSEWTLADIQSLILVITPNTDASPAVRCTQVGMIVWVNYTTFYRLDATITYSNVISTPQTIGYYVFCQGYRSGDTESIKVQAWDYIASQWNDKITISAGSDTDYDFALTTNEQSVALNEIKFRIIDANWGDATQTIAYFDVLKVMRIEEGYALDVEMTTSTVPEYGDIWLRIKGYTSSEHFIVQTWNYTSLGWDENRITITATSNTWYQYNLVDTQHRSGGVVKIRFLDATNYTSDTIRDTLYLDVAWVTLYYSDPKLTQDGSNSPKNYGETMSFWVIYTDYDNQPPLYIYVNIAGVDYSMIKNDSGDTTYYDSCAYYYQKSDIPYGTHNYYFKTKDANSGEIITGIKQLTINAIPTLTYDGVNPATGNEGITLFSFYCIYTDADNNAPSYIKVRIDSTDYDMEKKDSGDNDYTDGCAYHFDTTLTGGTHNYYFKTRDYMSNEVTTSTKQVVVNNIPELSNFQRIPNDPVYRNTQLTFIVTYTDEDNEMPTTIKWREDGGSTQNLTMTETDPGDTDCTDGKDYQIQLYLEHGTHNYDFWATDGYFGVSGGSNSVNIANRNPIITNDPGTPHEYRNTYWEFDFDYSDADADSVVWAISSNATFLVINSSTGLVYGTTDNLMAWYLVTVWANDSYGGSDWLTFSLYLVNRNPIIISTGNTTQQLNTFMSYEIIANDPDGDTLSYELSTNATFLSIENRWLNGTPNSIGWFWYVIWANDSYGGSDLEERILTITGLGEPKISGSPKSEITVWYLYWFNATATNADSGINQWSLQTNASWLSITWYNQTKCNVSGIPKNGVVFYANLTVYDDDSSDYINWTITIKRFAPIITSVAITTGYEDKLYSYSLTANQTISVWSKTGNATFISFIGSILSGVPNNAFANQYYWVNITAINPNGTAYQNFTLIIYNRQPVFTNSPNLVAVVGVYYSWNANHDDEGIGNPPGNWTTIATNFTGTYFFNNANGLLYFVPYTTGQFWFNITADDQRGAWNSTNYYNWSISIVSTPVVPPGGGIVDIPVPPPYHKIFIFYVSYNQVYFKLNETLNVVFCVWMFGDGTVSYEKEVKHTYEKAGIYYVRLLIIDKAGQTSEYHTTITIKPLSSIIALDGDTFLFGIGQTIYRIPLILVICVILVICTELLWIRKNHIRNKKNQGDRGRL